MSPYLTDLLSSRRTELQGSSDVADVARNLNERLVPLLARPLYVPEAKAQLSRDGGVCVKDGARLTFDPFSPDHHQCDKCGVLYSGERHHRAWVWRYHLWLSEHIVHASLLTALGQHRYDDWAFDVIRAYCEKYRNYPNRDNVLGPTRIFFSTYLESIWLIQLVLAAMICEHASAPLPKHLRKQLESVVDESSRIIASFHEGGSNRQVWNSTAILSAGVFLDDRQRIEQALSPKTGLRFLLAEFVSEAGRWHEGENYHFFSLRGFLLAAEIARMTGVDLYREWPRLGEMYAAPLCTLLPDLTLPARGDSPFGVSIRQPRFAELWEVGYRRTGDERLGDVLASIYADSANAPKPSLNEMAEVEQNRPAVPVARGQLGWKALVWMSSHFARRRDETVPSSGFVEPAGPIVIRPAARRYVALECQGTGDGHGHPDQLHLTVWDAGAVQLDLGTASYVTESLHWYRSWLAHTGPVRRGTDGRAGSVISAGWAGEGDWFWGQASIGEFAGLGTVTTRSVIVGGEYVLDVVDVTVPSDVEIALPVHPFADTTQATTNGLRVEPWFDIGFDGLLVEAFDDPLRRMPLTNGGEVLLAARAGERLMTVHAPGPPDLLFADGVTMSFPLRCCSGAGRWVQLFARSRDVISEIVVSGEMIDVRRGDATDRFLCNEGMLTVESRDGTIILRGINQRTVRRDRGPDVSPAKFAWPILPEEPESRGFDELLEKFGVALGRAHYRRSERPYRNESAFSARCCLVGCGHKILFVVNVVKEDLWIMPADWVNPKLDNESGDIHSDSVQLYWGSGGSSLDGGVETESWKGFLIRPTQDGNHQPHIRPIRGTDAGPDDLTARFERTGNGYRVVAMLSRDPDSVSHQEFRFNVVVNEMHEGRERRAGQLALSGGGWVYLRGDREDRGESPMGTLI